jgi:[NiFe] hydrogenase diaphorase moiety small subunit
MRRIDVTIDGIRLQVEPGTTALEAARLAGRHVPTLCHHPDLRDVGACRLCLVEVAGEKMPQAACAYPLEHPTEIRTSSARIRQARQDIVDLLLAEHPGDRLTSARAGAYELDDLAAAYGSRTDRFAHQRAPVHEPDVSGPIVFDLDKCINCLRCVRACAELQQIDVLGVMGRGADMTVSPYLGLPLSSTACITCGQCIAHCPTGALSARDETDAVWRAINDPNKHVVIQTAPAPRAAMGEEFGLEPGTATTWKLNTALRDLGFDRVFDTSFGADLTVIEESAELLERLHATLVLGDSTRPLPMFTSCSPGWVTYVEHRYPQWREHLSSCKSPQQMFGALIKTWYADLNDLDPADVVSVSLMPCTAKKFEAARPEMASSGHRDVDHVLTTREVAAMIRRQGLPLPDLPESDFDDPFGTASGSGVIFGVTGGVMESALRTVLELITGRPVEDLFDHADVVPVRGFDGVRYAAVTVPDDLGPVPPLLAGVAQDWSWLGGVTLRLAVVHGTANAERVMADIAAGGQFSRCHFIEFMACPGGCLGGGGQPVPTSAAIRAARARAIYAEDARYGQTGRARKSHRNPAVLRLYEDLLTDGPGGATSHALLHTTYTARDRWLEGTEPTDLEEVAPC